jgi:hypothetical protein
MRRAATIYIGEDRIVMCPNHPVTQGGSFSGPPIHTLAHSASVEKILAELDETLAECHLVPLPTDYKAAGQPLFAATGEKTWHAISRSFAYIGVSEEGADGVVFYSGFPEKGGFLFQTEAHWRCKKSSRADMAAAFRAAAAVSIEAQNLRNPPPLP